ncbi:conserved membrane hypothetical protein [Gammaproteobacteria bacterium]
METTNTANQTTSVQFSGVSSSLGTTILRVAWMSIVLAIIIQILSLFALAGVGPLADFKTIVSEFVQKITWATIVCTGIAFGKVASKLQPQAMGLLGFLAAPTGFTVARAAQKSVAEALKNAAPVAGGASPFLLAGLKALEYAVLGLIIGWLGKRAWGGALAHVTVGLGIGIIGGGTCLAVMDWYNPTPLTLPALLYRGVNEVIFPVGCSLVLFAAERVGKRLGK